MQVGALRWLGVCLIHAGVFLRCLYRLPRLEHPAWVVALLVLNAALLVLEAVLSRREALHARSRMRAGALLRPLYLLSQAAIVLALLLNRPLLDFCALLFIPISMSAVLYYGRRGGFAWIAVLTLAMAVPLIALQANKAAGAIMTLTYGGLAFLLGGYAHQIQEAEAARSQTRRTLGKLQIAHAQLQEAASQREELSAEQERNRLARELHDSVTQTVFSMNLTVQTARLLFTRDTARVAMQLQRLDDLAAKALGEIQALVSSLRPGPTAGESLPDALRRLAASGSPRLVAERESRGGEVLQVTVEVTGDRPLPAAVSAGLYLIAQEALTNVAKHSGVREATVRLDLREPAFLEVEDHGRGFVPAAVAGQSGHLGLAGMAERAHDLGWRLVVESAPGRGACIRAEEARAEAHRTEGSREISA